MKQKPELIDEITRSISWAFGRSPAMHEGLAVCDVVDEIVTRLQAGGMSYAAIGNMLVTAPILRARVIQRGPLFGIETSIPPRIGWRQLHPGDPPKGLWFTSEEMAEQWLKHGYSRKIKVPIVIEVNRHGTEV